MESTIGRSAASSRLLLSRALCLLFLVLISTFFTANSVSAESLFFTDSLGNPSAAVEPGEDFQVLLHVADASGLEALRVRLTVAGPVHAVGSAAPAPWFAQGHELADLGQGQAGSADFITALLMDPPSLSGDGAVVVFTLHADGEGVAAVSLAPDCSLATTRGMVYPEQPTFPVLIGEGIAQPLGLGFATMGLAQALIAEASLVEQQGGGGQMLLMGGETDSIIYGDVDRNGNTNLLDLIKIRNCLNARSPFTLEIFRCDVDGNGWVNILDMIQVRDHINLRVPIPMRIVHGEDVLEVVPPSIT